MAILKDLRKTLFVTSGMDATTALYKRVTVYFGLPIVLIFGLYNVPKEMEEHRQSHFVKPDRAYLNIRKKAFPWKHGEQCSLLDLKCHQRAKEAERQH